MLGQLVGIFIPTLLEEPAQQKIVLVRLHVVLKRRSARASLPIDGLVVDKAPTVPCPWLILALMDFRLSAVPLMLCMAP